MSTKRATLAQEICALLPASDREYLAALSANLLQCVLRSTVVGDEDVDLRHRTHLGEGDAADLGRVGQHDRGFGLLVQHCVDAGAHRVVRRASGGVYAIDADERDVDVVAGQEALGAGADRLLAAASHLSASCEDPKLGVGNKMRRDIERVRDNRQSVEAAQEASE